MVTIISQGKVYRYAVVFEVVVEIPEGYTVKYNHQRLFFRSNSGWCGGYQYFPNKNEAKIYKRIEDARKALEIIKDNLLVCRRVEIEKTISEIKGIEEKHSISYKIDSWSDLSENENCCIGSLNNKEIAQLKIQRLKSKNGKFVWADKW